MRIFKHLILVHISKRTDNKTTIQMNVYTKMSYFFFYKVIETMHNKI